MKRNRDTAASRRRKVLRQRRRMMTLLPVFLLVTVLLLSSFSGKEDKTEGERAAETSSQLPVGVYGMVDGLRNARESKQVKRIGSPLERVVVGQIVSVNDGRADRMNFGDDFRCSVQRLKEEAAVGLEAPKIMSDYDYESLLAIVEAEAGTEDLKGRILVANVIMNRVKHEEFPDTIAGVIWENRNGVPQFSPTYDGTIYTTTVTELTHEAVLQAINGVDYSEGALFFIQRDAAEAHNVLWFDKELKRLFKHGVHEFYKYPDSVTDASDLI